LSRDLFKSVTLLPSTDSQNSKSSSPCGGGTMRD
jgi:hypothetical protein